eukprot:TRINITY_DN7017_c0_g1_i1.p1 TRINITY_DN7017_c0_g1~~TRINITY_DN7017_c0_g1_i1.p1  ORF type:complete len:152 (+),score=54.07 TRINITY_DN7017_c0_g1_i1:82-537(+)
MSGVGRLKLKGAPSSSHSKKKKKSKSGSSKHKDKHSRKKDKERRRRKEREREEERDHSSLKRPREDDAPNPEDEAGRVGGDDANTKGEGSEIAGFEWMTPSQQKFALVQQQRKRRMIEKEVKMSHKEKLASLNKYLEGLTEHNDIPKVGPG